MSIKFQDISSVIHVHKQSLYVLPGNPSASFLSYKTLPSNDYQPIVWAQFLEKAVILKTIFFCFCCNHYLQTILKKPQFTLA